MKTSNLKNLTTLSTVYGVTPEWVKNFCDNKARGIFSFDWFDIYFGRDSEKNPILFVVTPEDNFLLSAAPLPNVRSCKTRKPIEWVFSIDGKQNDFYDNRVYQPYSFCHSGFRVIFGKDTEQRDFLFVKLPNCDFRLLFRNPASESTVAWNPRRADSVVAWNPRRANSVPATSANPPVTPAARVFPVAYVEESSGDQELDDLLASLG